MTAANRDRQYSAPTICWKRDVVLGLVDEFMDKPPLFSLQSQYSKSTVQKNGQC